MAILLDTSSYFGLGNFAQLKLFAKHLLNYFELTANRLNTFVGFIPYSGKIVDKFVINFRYSYSIERLSVKIDQLHFYDTWETRLDLALKYSREKLFTVYNGSRPWVPHVVLAITGSVQHWDLAQRDAVQREAVLLRESDVKLMIASIDPTQSNQGYLRSLVDSQEHLYMLSYPYLLYGISENIARQACPVSSKSQSYL